MTQKEEFEKICQYLASLDLLNKKQQFVKKTHFGKGLENLRLYHIIHAISNHLQGSDGFTCRDLIINRDYVFLTIPMENSQLIQKYYCQYSNGEDWILEACLDIYLGLYEIGFMNYANDTIYKLLREKAKLLTIK